MVIAKSFKNKREAIQGFNRVGRFNDGCKRIIFDDVPLVNKREEMLYNASLMKFIKTMKANPLVLKSFRVKKYKFRKIMEHQCQIRGNQTVDWNY